MNSDGKLSPLNHNIVSTVGITRIAQNFIIWHFFYLVIRNIFFTQNSLRICFTSWAFLEIRYRIKKMRCEGYAHPYGTQYVDQIQKLLCGTSGCVLELTLTA